VERLARERYDGAVGVLTADGRKVAVLLLEAQDWTFTRWHRLRRPTTRETKLGWKVSFVDPPRPPDEGFYGTDTEASADLDRSIFVYQGIPYQISWLDGDTAEDMRQAFPDLP
jgi:hypothetical protein